MIPKKYEKHMSNDARIAVLETTILNINANLIDMRHDFKHAFEKMDSKLDTLESKMDSKFDAVQNRLWSNFLWLMGMIIGLAGLIAHTQHWV